MDRTIDTGIYIHFKNPKNKYETYALAQDYCGNTYIIYQAQYGNRDYWVRNIDDFTSEVEYEGKTVRRFRLEKRIAADKQRGKLITNLKSTDIILTDAETGTPYKIYKINENNVYICKFDTGAYLSNVDLAYRMGYSMIVINDQIFYRHSSKALPDNRKLVITAPDGKDISSTIIHEQFNPCSIDLHISENDFIKTKHFKIIDPISLKSINEGIDYWKSIKIRNNCISIRPNQAVLTHIYEKIKIPDDCAGKIEIKSTYSRLSLSITEGDFCNPGYEGYFPLVIRNDGNCTVVIHPKEMMAQLILVRTSDSIISNYSENATHKNVHGFDDGTPYSFWYERSIKNFRKQNGAEYFYNYYHLILDSISKDTSTDINAEKERFKNSFLTYISKRFPHNTTAVDANMLTRYANAYANREKKLKRIFSIKWLSALGSGVTFLWGIVSQISSLFPEYDEAKLFYKLFEVVNTITVGKPSSIILFITALALATLSIFLFIKRPKAFCTFEQMDLAAIAQATMNKSTNNS